MRSASPRPTICPARLAYERSDELGTLAKAFDNMVERLAQTRRELVDRSFESGAAENASGVLHNLGNAMTPLAVNVAKLQQQLGAVSTDRSARRAGRTAARHAGRRAAARPAAVRAAVGG